MPPIYLKNIPLTLNTLVWSFLLLNSLSRVSLLHCCGSLDVLNGFKIFTFHGHFYIGKELEVKQCQILRIKYMSTYLQVFMGEKLPKTFKINSGNPGSHEKTLTKRASRTSLGNSKNCGMSTFEARSGILKGIGDNLHF